MIWYWIAFTCVFSGLWIFSSLLAVSIVSDLLDRKKCKKPEQKTGKWYDIGSLSCRCSRCGGKSPQEFNFCPNCGAEMSKEARSE